MSIGSRLTGETRTAGEIRDAVYLGEGDAGANRSRFVDLVAAATTGLAGAFAVGRRDIGDILPGVAIAISLVPPLAVVGVTAVDGEWADAMGTTSAHARCTR